MRLFKKIFKIVLLVLFVVAIGLYIVFVRFSRPKSDRIILDSYKESTIKPSLTHEKFRGFEYRKIKIQKNDSLPTILFIHGAIGSLHDFSKYMKDSLLQTKANMVAYDRIGYGYKDENSVQESIAFERDMVINIMAEIPSDKVILVGYSYGGPIALAVNKKVQQVILLAPAVYSDFEFIPWTINLYKWGFSRGLLPDVWKEASKEKLSHKQNLAHFEHSWQQNPNNIISVHGTSDWIVPFENSERLQNIFPKEQFKLVDIEDVGHELVWTEFDLIKQQILNYLD
ncbi:alpha/beta fold hydrolase [Tenacibaculum sp. IB213877]|uniref:alpha/beta fold hydrolase n=1 Tax=Tenacibaculum sp. IB213877 TaxID=3097351 RepID=UPI002A5AF1CB|nr:alpha/beta fold hydrolase [Tenacibaculum sp. IB213877]MDY0779911.1 alpha/beta fold hydrolase [Tenacibaculum sp. IB213877]